MDLRDRLSSLDIPPSKILKIVLGLALVLLLMWLFTLSHIDYNQGPDAQEYITSQAQSDSVAVLGSSSKEAKEISSYEESSGVFTNGLITFLVLLVVLIMIWFWVDRKESGGGSQRELASQVLGEGARLKIIRINEEVWVLGVTSSSVNLLHRYPENDWKEQMPEVESDSGDMFRKLFKSKMS
jgi:flagellar biogenesis protein FliO